MRILAAFIITLVSALACRAQVYYVGVYSMGRTYEHDWTFGSGSMRFGAEQYLQYQDSSGRNLISFKDVTGRRAACTRFSTFYFGPVHFTQHGPAWRTAAFSGITLVSLVFLFAVGMSRLGRRVT